MIVQLTFRDFPPSDSIRAYVVKRADKLLTRYDRIVALKVALEAPHHHQQRGNSYRVRIDVVIPGSEFVVAPQDGGGRHADLYTAIDDAFDDAARRLLDHAQIRRGETKSHGVS
jgi:ribosomal subunit interface protein